MGRGGQTTEPNEILFGEHRRSTVSTFAADRLGNRMSDAQILNLEVITKNYQYGDEVGHARISFEAFARDHVQNWVVARQEAELLLNEGAFINEDEDEGIYEQYDLMDDDCEALRAQLEILAERDLEAFEHLDAR